MKRSMLIPFALFVVIGLGYLEISYFRFHTYFQVNNVDEVPIEAATDASAGEPTSVMTVGQGSFVAVDAIHKGSGSAKMFQDADKFYLRFEDFKVTNGPDLYVYLSDSLTPGNTPGSLGNYVSLGLLKGNTGNQTYSVPAEYSGYRTVVIWCKKFGVLFTFAVLE